MTLWHCSEAVTSIWHSQKQSSTLSKTPSRSKTVFTGCVAGQTHCDSNCSLAQPCMTAYCTRVKVSMMQAFRQALKISACWKCVFEIQCIKERQQSRRHARFKKVTIHTNTHAWPWHVATWSQEGIHSCSAVWNQHVTIRSVTSCHEIDHFHSLGSNCCHQPGLYGGYGAV